MQIQELLEEARASFGAQRVYAEPYEKNGITVIPAASVRGGGGGGFEGEEKKGGGFGLMARPTGAWVIEGNEVEWKSTLDVNKVALGAELVLAIGLLRLLTPRTIRLALPDALRRVPFRPRKRRPLFLRAIPRHVPFA
jgi:hypothetical protein